MPDFHDFVFTNQIVMGIVIWLFFIFEHFNFTNPYQGIPVIYVPQKPIF